MQTLSGDCRKRSRPSNYLLLKASLVQPQRRNPAMPAQIRRKKRETMRLWEQMVQLRAPPGSRPALRIPSSSLMRRQQEPLKKRARQPRFSSRQLQTMRSPSAKR